MVYACEWNRASFIHFCGKKWIKDALFQSHWYTLAGIAETNIHHVCLLRTSNSDHLARRMNHCITRIRQQVDENLLQLDPVAYHDYFFFGNEQLHFNLPEAQLF